MGKTVENGYGFSKDFGWRKGIEYDQTCDGFALTAAAYWDFLDENGLRTKLEGILTDLDHVAFSNLKEVGARSRSIMLAAPLPKQVKASLLSAYRSLLARSGGKISVAVRSSATAEDLPTASFAGQMESYLNISSEQDLLEACCKCYASLFTDRAIEYRELNHFSHMAAAVSVGIQIMVRSDLVCSGVGFTLDPDSGFKDVVVITGSWGLGENIAQGQVSPDQFVVFKPSLRNHKKAIVSRKLGSKELTMTYGESNSFASTTINRTTSVENREIFVLADHEVESLARQAMVIEEHYGRPMDIE